MSTPRRSARSALAAFPARRDFSAWIRAVAGPSPKHNDPRLAVAQQAFTIRAATTDDASTLASLRIALFQELGQEPLPGVRDAFLTASAAALAMGIGRGYCHAWLAESDEGEVVGSIVMLISPKLPSPVSLATEEGYLLNVYTTPEWRRRGVAAALVAKAIERARRLGLGRLRLHATADGRAVYAAAGFRLRDDEMELRLDD